MYHVWADNTEIRGLELWNDIGIKQNQGGKNTGAKVAAQAA
jgi:hypothetical protein